LTSSARRAVQTAELVVAELEVGVELMVERALYGADPDDVIDILRGLDDDVTSVMVVGHNPTMHELALGLLDGEDTEAVTVLERGFPTAALAVLGVTDHVWTTVTLGSATFLDLRTVDH
jgi:phosphohistidine phosphatase